MKGHSRRTKPGWMTCRAAFGVTMRDRSDRYPVPSISALASPKKIGGYLVDAGLLSTDQINVALNDQQATGMRFGEIIVALGWLKEQTVEWIMTKVVEPERQRRASAEHQPAPNTWGNQQRSQALRKPVGDSSSANSGYGTAAAKQAVKQPNSSPAANPETGHKPFVRREVPISKPLPSVGSSDGDVNWVG